MLAAALIWAWRHDAPQRARYLIALTLGGGIGVSLAALFLLSAARFHPSQFLGCCLIAAPLGGLIALTTILVAEGGDDADAVS